MMIEHTPGPWFVTDAGCGCFDISNGTPNEHGEVEHGIATVWGNRPSLSATAHGDARLIAAAPDLLEAVRAIADGCESRLRKGKDSGDLMTLRLCRAVIAIAKGGE
jgi:hypothetical protein